jgi:hypothetical protein
MQASYLNLLTISRAPGGTVNGGTAIFAANWPAITPR